MTFAFLGLVESSYINTRTLRSTVEKKKYKILRPPCLGRLWRFLQIPNYWWLYDSWRIRPQNFRIFPPFIADFWQCVCLHGLFNQGVLRGEGNNALYPNSKVTGKPIFQFWLAGWCSPKFKKKSWFRIDDVIAVMLEPYFERNNVMSGPNITQTQFCLLKILDDQPPDVNHRIPSIVRFWQPDASPDCD